MSAELTPDRLVEHALASIAREEHQPLHVLAPGVLERLTAHPWPGNVRHLEQLAARLVLEAPEGPVTRISFRGLLAGMLKSMSSARSSVMVRPATTARIVANATALMNAKKSSPPRCSASSGALMF